MKDLFDNYEALLNLRKGIKDDFLLNKTNDCLNYLKDKLFKSDEHLDSILDKDVNDVTIQDINDILYKFADPDNHGSWKLLTTVHSTHLSFYNHGLSISEPCIRFDLDGFSLNKRFHKQGFSIDDENVGSYDYKRVGLMKQDRMIVINNILNMYRVCKLNPKSISSTILSYSRTWNTKREKDEYWEGLYSWLIKCEDFKTIEETNFDYSKISNESKNLHKSLKSSKKFNLTT